MSNKKCPICQSESIRQEFKSETLEVYTCAACDHRFAAHYSKPIDSDYYDNTPTNEKFVSSLLHTRKRQALETLEYAAKQISALDAWVDYGCGRGAFLDAAKKFGVHPLGGFDASNLASQWMREKGFPMARPSQEDAGWPAWNSLPFSPKVMSLLDVIEHFPGESVIETLRRMKREVDSLEYFVIKVPISSGFLFNTARFARGFAPGPYLQLFQVGTSPPHFHYFSRESFRRLARACGLVIEKEWTSSEVDNIFHRIPTLSFLPAGEWATLPIKAFAGDAYTAICKVVRS